MLSGHWLSSTHSTLSSASEGVLLSKRTSFPMPALSLCPPHSAGEEGRSRISHCCNGEYSALSTGDLVSGGANCLEKIWWKVCVPWNLSITSGCVSWHTMISPFICALGELGKYILSAIAQGCKSTLYLRHLKVSKSKYVGKIQRLADVWGARFAEEIASFWFRICEIWGRREVWFCSPSVKTCCCLQGPGFCQRTGRFLCHLPKSRGSTFLLAGSPLCNWACAESTRTGLAC